MAKPRKYLDSKQIDINDRDISDLIVNVIKATYKSNYIKVTVSLYDRGNHVVTVTVLLSWSFNQGDHFVKMTVVIKVTTLL